LKKASHISNAPRISIMETMIQAKDALETLGRYPPLPNTTVPEKPYVKRIFTVPFFGSKSDKL